MEVSGVVYRQPPCFAALGGGGGSGGSRITETQKTQTLSSPSLSCNASRLSLCCGRESQSWASMNSRRRVKKWVGGLCGFRDESHLLYYYGNKKLEEEEEEEEEEEGMVVRCGGNKKRKEIKKKLKVLKTLSKDFSACSRSGSSSFVVDVDDLGESIPVQTNLISKAAEVLMKQLEQMREDEKAMKRKKKEEKAMMKSAMGARMKCTNLDSGSSSSSSESSDSDCGEVVDMKQLRNESIPVTVQQPLLELQQFSQSDTAPVQPVSTLVEESKPMESNCFHDCNLITNGQESCSQPSMSFSVGTNVLLNDTVMEGKAATRIEVCMGNKCKKMGGAALLEEFEKVMGVEGAVVGCKCMGKCRNGPNVRVLNSVDEEEDNSVMAPANPLCIGVGLEDVASIVADFIGKEAKSSTREVPAVDSTYGTVSLKSCR